MKSFDLLIFDWDGTLADSAALIVESLQTAIRGLALAPREDAQIRELIGLSLADGLAKLYPQEDPQRLAEVVIAYRSRYFSSHAFEAPLFHGAEACLQSLLGEGYLLAIATGKSRRGLDRSLKHHQGLQKTLVASRTADETAPKPDPQMLKELLFEFDCAPERALMIGDTEYDALMARSVGVAMVGVGCGVHAPERLLDAGAQVVLDSVADLPSWLSMLVHSQ